MLGSKKLQVSEQVNFQWCSWRKKCISRMKGGKKLETTHSMSSCFEQIMRQTEGGDLLGHED